MSNLPYDASKLRSTVIAHAPSSTGLSVPGTAASNTVILRIPVPNDSIRLNSMVLRMSTGGTAAGPNITIGKSLAGTGATSAIGTVAFGTSADGTMQTVSLTATDFDRGDLIMVTNLAGTAASTPVIIFSLGYQE